MVKPKGAPILAFPDSLAGGVPVQFQTMQALTPALKERLDELVTGVEDDLDQVIEGEVAL